MKNREKYREESIESCANGTMCENIIKPIMLPAFGLNCKSLDCRDCYTLLHMWLEEEYKEPETDWSKVAVDTPVLVRNGECEKWIPRHFAKFEEGKVYAFDNGTTRWTRWTSTFVSPWSYAKLAELEVSNE